MSLPTPIITGILATVFLGTGGALAFSASSPNYNLDQATINSFGGRTSSTNYGLFDSGGEPFIGPGASTNYRLNAGQIAALEHTISLTLDAYSISIPPVSPGASQTAETQATVFTDAAGYFLYARQDGDLTHTNRSTTIPAVSGSITTPILWTEGATTGFGFSLVSGTGLNAKWGTNPNFQFAAFPFDATVIHDKAGYQNAGDVTTIRYRLDTSPVQLPGTYTNFVTYIATVKP